MPAKKSGSASRSIRVRKSVVMRAARAPSSKKPPMSDRWRLSTYLRLLTANHFTYSHRNRPPTASSPPAKPSGLPTCRANYQHIEWLPPRPPGQGHRLIVLDRLTTRTCKAELLTRPLRCCAQMDL